MIDIPSKLFERDINCIEVGVSDIYLYSKKEIEKGQEGYRYNSKTGKPIEDWIGEEYIVIGYDSCCGDPIITDISDENLPIYYMFHDDWSSLEKIANSFKQFIEILHKIDDTNLSDEDEKNNLTKEIIKEVPEEGLEYWDSLIQVAYEFLNDIN